MGNRHVPQLGISTNLPLKLLSVLQSATHVLPSWCLLAFTRNHDPKSLRGICTPVSGARWDHGTLLLRLIWAALRGCTQASLYSRLQEHEDSTVDAPERGSLPWRGQISLPMHPGAKPRQSRLIWQKHNFWLLAEAVTHRIFLPLLAFLSTFFFILLRNFWMASHCLRDAKWQLQHF